MSATRLRVSMNDAVVICKDEKAVEIREVQAAMAQELCAREKRWLTFRASRQCLEKAQGACAGRLYKVSGSRKTLMMMANATLLSDSYSIEAKVSERGSGGQEAQGRALLPEWWLWLSVQTSVGSLSRISVKVKVIATFLCRLLLR